jgi:hypothetical protein
MIFLQDSCSQIRFHVFNVIFLTAGLVRRIRLSHISEACVASMLTVIESRRKLTIIILYEVRKQKHIHMFIYTGIYI